MKKITFFLLLVLWSMNQSAYAQIIPESQVPKAVLDQYNKDFPGIKAKHWELNNWKPKKQYVAALNNSNGIETRARYIEDGTKVWYILSYTANQVPAGTSANTLSLFPGFKIDWATEVVDFTKNTDVFDLRLSKPAYILHAYVNPNGTSFTDSSKMPDQFKLNDKN